MSVVERRVYRRQEGRALPLALPEGESASPADLWNTPQTEAILIYEQAADSSAAVAWAEQYGIPLHLAGSVFEDHTRPRLYEDGEVILVSVMDPLDPEAEMLVVTKPHALVCLSNRPMSWWNEFVVRWGRGNYLPPYAGPRALYSLLDEVVDAVFPVLDAAQERVDDLGSQIIAGGTVQQSSVLQELRILIQLRHQVAPMRDQLNSLLRRDQGCIPDEVRDDFADVYAHTHRILESVELILPFLSTLIETQLNSASLKLNEIMKVLTVSSIVLMSVTLIASIYGMNFKNMPELNHPWGYPIALLSMLLLAGGLILTFRRRGWL